MSDPNPFDDLAEDSEEIEDSASDDSRAEFESQTQPPEESDPNLGQSTSAIRSAQDDSTASSETPDASQGVYLECPTLNNSSPPFTYSEAEQKQMYVQDGLWKKFEDLGFDAELELRRTFDVRNVEQRELDTAIIRLVLNQLTPGEIAEMVIQMRGFDPSTFD